MIMSKSIFKIAVPVIALTFGSLKSNGQQSNQPDLSNKLDSLVSEMNCKIPSDEQINFYGQLLEKYSKTLDKKMRLEEIDIINYNNYINNYCILNSKEIFNPCI